MAQFDWNKYRITDKEQAPPGSTVGLLSPGTSLTWLTFNRCDVLKHTPSGRIVLVGGDQYESKGPGRPYLKRGDYFKPLYLITQEVENELSRDKSQRLAFQKLREISDKILKIRSDDISHGHLAGIMLAYDILVAATVKPLTDLDRINAAREVLFGQEG